MEDPDPREAPKINDEGARRIEPPSGNARHGEIPIDIQDKFKKWANATSSGFIRHEVDPTRLFCVRENNFGRLTDLDPSVQRDYHYYDGDGDFDIAQKSYFGKIDGKWLPRSVVKLSESRKQRQYLSFSTRQQYKYSILLETSNSGIPNPPPDMQFIRVLFDPKGNLAKIDQPNYSENPYWEIDPQALITRAQARHNRTSQAVANGMLGFQYKHGDNFIEATFNTNDDDLFVTRVTKIPIKIDPVQIKEQLFPPSIFEDPYNVDPDDDSSWLNADLEKAIGIEDIPVARWNRT